MYVRTRSILVTRIVVSLTEVFSRDQRQPEMGEEIAGVGSDGHQAKSLRKSLYVLVYLCFYSRYSDCGSEGEANKIREIQIA